MSKTIYRKDYIRTFKSAITTVAFNLKTAQNIIVAYMYLCSHISIEWSPMNVELAHADDLEQAIWFS